MNETLQANQLVRMPAAAIAALHRAIATDRDPEEAAHLLRRIGLEAGSAYYDLFRQWLADEAADDPDPDRLGPDEFWNRLSDFFDALGFGDLKYETLHPGVFALSSDRWIEADVPEGDHQGCQLTTGLIAEFLRHVAGRDLAVLEVECRGSGDGRCRFLGGSPAALEQVFQEMQRGSRYDDAVASLA